MTSETKPTKRKSLGGSVAAPSQLPRGFQPQPTIPKVASRCSLARGLTGKFVVDTQVWCVVGKVVRVDHDGLAHGLYIDKQGRLVGERITAIQNNWLWSDYIMPVNQCLIVYYGLEKAFDTLIKVLAECGEFSASLESGPAPAKLLQRRPLPTKLSRLQGP